MVEKPTGIADYFEQLRPPIVRGGGVTPSERYLAKLADQTFLNLWSYPNPYRSQKLAGGRDGKEFCDLLVVCDPHILIFSEKSISWTEKPLDVAWPRWFRKAVLAAETQLKGAERWIAEFPDRIFLDAACETPFPLAFPPIERRRVHRIIVARGAAEACRNHFGDPLGTLILMPSLQGKSHYDASDPQFEPFFIGDIDPSGDFVHVFDEVALDIVMSELDTISDFTSYLDKRAIFFRSGRLGLAYGEEELLAYYAVRLNAEGEHDFTPPSGTEWEPEDQIVIGPGQYLSYIGNPQYKAKKEADTVSYAWDRLIETFTNHILGGTSIVLPGYEYSLNNNEMAVRHMALLPRLMRRAHSEAILSALSIGEQRDTFFRAMIARETSRGSDTGFFFLTIKYLEWMDADGGYEKYRLFRTFYLETYAQALLMKLPYLRHVIGIAMEPPNQGRGASEDNIYAQQMEWTQAQRDSVQSNCQELRIMGSLRETSWRGEEFPQPVAGGAQAPSKGNRHHRRAEAAKQKRQLRRLPQAPPV